MLAVARPVGSLSERVLAALPADLAGVLQDTGSVLLTAIADGGSKATAERQIRAVLRVVATLLSHTCRAICFSWSGRRRLLGGAAALEEMLLLSDDVDDWAAALPAVVRLCRARARVRLGLREAAEPVGRHSTEGGAARDPLSFVSTGRL